MKQEYIGFTVKQLIEDLRNYPDDMEVYFGGLDLYRLVEKGNKVLFEFNQSVYKDKDGRVIVENHE